MATADELLAAAAEAEDKILTADLSTRVISIPASVKVLGVEADDDVHRLQFRIPRYYGEFDLHEFKVNVNYENARRGGDVYPVDDLALSTDNNYITFSWLVDRYAFTSAGDVKFSICMKKYDSEVVVKEFNTTFATLPVLAGLETDKAATNNAAPGVLDTVLMRLYAVEAASGLGVNGYYTVINMTESDDGTVFTIVDRNGSVTATVRHGTDGEDGYTPVKGVDYFTEAEQDAIEDNVAGRAKAYIDNWAPKCVAVELKPNAWEDNLQIVSVPGVTTNSVVIVTADPSNDNFEVYGENEIRCIAQGESSLTFKCSSVPSVNVIANVAIYHSLEEVTNAMI